MKTPQQKLFTNKKYIIFGGLLTLALVLPTSLVFASSGNLGLLADFMTTIMMPFHFLVTISGTLMGVTMYYTIVRMGYYVHQLGALQTAWELFRDLANIFIVFGFIAIGIATILDNATYGVKKALPKLLIAAILLNFSLFFAEFIADTGNVFATQFYTSINGGKLPSSASTFSVSKEPISGSIMTVLKTTSLYKVTDPPLPTGEMIELALISIIMFIIMAFVFFAIAIMLISRFVVLIFLFIVSPIGFISLAGIPLISDYGKRWWKILTNQTIFAPILLLFLLVVTKMIQSDFMQALTGGDTIPQALSNSNVTPMANILLSFSVVMGLLFLSLIAAKSLSGRAANFAIGQSRKRLSQAFSISHGGSARIIRGAARLTGDNKFSRGVEHVMRPIERSKFDLVGKLGGKQFLGMKEPEDTSYRHWASHGVLGKEGPIRGNLKKITEKNLSERSDDARKRQKKDAEREIRDALRRKADAEENKKRDPEHAAQYDAEIAEADKTISDNLSELSSKEITKLADISRGAGSLAKNLSPERFSMLMKDESLLEQQKSKLRNQRFAPIAKAVANNDITTIRDQSTKDLEQYATSNPDGFAATSTLLSDSQVDQLRKSGSLNTSQVDNLTKQRDARFNINESGDLSQNAKTDLGKMAPEDISKLSADILRKPAVLNNISPRKIASLINTPGNLSDDKHVILVEHVRKEMRDDTINGRHFMSIITSDPTAAARWGI